MASPQKEHGYTAIANEIIEALARTRITSEARRVFDTIIRRTYGWNKKHADITYRQFEAATGLRQAHVYRALRSLLQHRLIEKCSSGYCVQKDYEKWIPFSKGYSKRGASSTFGAESYSEQGVSPTPNEEHPTPRKSNNDNGSQRAKDSIKDNVKTSLSEEREKLEKRIEKIFPQCVSIPKGISTEKLFLFVYRISRGEIKAENIGSPVAYMKGMLDEDVTPLLEKMQRDSRVRAAQLEKARTDRADMEKLREENSAEMSQLIRDFVTQLEGRHAVGV